MAKLNINGKVRDVQAEAGTPLLWVIREQVGLTGTKYGCGVAQCGACSVHINGEVRRSCSVLISDMKPGDRIVTIEGLSATGSHPVQIGRASCRERSVDVGGRRIIKKKRDKYRKEMSNEAEKDTTTIMQAPEMSLRRHA